VSVTWRDNIEVVATYDSDGELAELGVAPLGRGSPRVYFDWLNDMHAWKTPASLAGTQWTDGVVVVGTVYDDDDGGGTTERAVALDDWVEECLGAAARR